MGILKSRRGDLSGPVLAILVTLILLAIGAVIIAYFTLLAGPTPTPVLVVKDQPIAYKNVTDETEHATVSILIANTGTAQVTLKTDLGGTNLTILAPSGLVTALTDPRAPLVSQKTIAPGDTVELRFTFSGEWSNFENYRRATARLLLVDTSGAIVGQFEVNIRIIGGG